MYFQDIILTLQSFWAKRGCLVVQPYNSEVGAGTYNPATFLRALGPEPWNVAFVEPSRRPADGRYGDNPNRLQQFHQFQVILKPSPIDIQDQYLESLRALGTKPEEHDLRFLEDDWESPTLGAWGLGWQVWLDGLEIFQFTYFQQVGGFDCKPVCGELTYGARAHRDVLARRRRRLRRDVRAERSLRRDLQSAPSGSGARTTSSKPTCRAFRGVRSRRERMQTSLVALGRPDEEPRPPRIRLRDEGGAHVQRARRARRDRRDGARALHRARARARAGVAEAWVAQRKALGHPLLIAATLAVLAFCVACGGGGGSSKYPSRSDGCDVKVFQDSPPMKTENIGPVNASCDEIVPKADCLRELKDQVCKLGGDAVWGVAPEPDHVGDKWKFSGRAVHTTP